MHHDEMNDYFRKIPIYTVNAEKAYPFGMIPKLLYFISHGNIPKKLFRAEPATSA